MILKRKVVFLQINLIFLTHLMQLKASLTFGMSFIFILTQKSLVLLHLEQLPSEGIRIQQPEIGSSDWEVYDPDVHN